VTQVLADRTERVESYRTGDLRRFRPPIKRYPTEHRYPRYRLFNQSKFWFLSNRVVLVDGKPQLCEDCPCEEPVCCDPLSLPDDLTLQLTRTTTGAACCCSLGASAPITLTRLVNPLWVANACTCLLPNGQTVARRITWNAETCILTLSCLNLTNGIGSEGEAWGATSVSCDPLDVEWDDVRFGWNVFGSCCTSGEPDHYSAVLTE
jgi:hypothetical protein